MTDRIELNEDGTLDESGRKLGEVQALLDRAVGEIDGWVAIYENCSISTGYCCCGDAMGDHDNPMNCGHSPVDQGWYVSGQQIESTRATLAAIREAQNG